MLSDKGYHCLQLVRQERTDEIQDFDTYTHLENCGYIAYSGAKIAYVTPLGEEACKEYEVKNATKECAEEANKIAEKALRKSSIANRISFISMIFGGGGIILSIVSLLSTCH